MWASGNGEDAYRRVPVVLRVQELQAPIEAEERRLLRLLFLRQCPLPTDPARYQLQLFLMALRAEFRPAPLLSLGPQCAAGRSGIGGWLFRNRNGRSQPLLLLASSAKSGQSGRIIQHIATRHQRAPG